MKKSYKSLILLGATTVAIASASILNTTNLLGKYEENIKAYIKNPSNALENIFMENNQIILPFIYENATQKMTADKIKEEFKKAGLTVKNISTGTEVGTGTKVTVNENSKVYNILVYGDVNGDGEVDLADAQKIILYKRNPGSVKLEGLYFKVANVGNDDNEVDLADAQRIIMFKRGTLPKRLVVVEPQTTKDSEKPVITLKGKQTETIEVGTIATYTDPGATAKDNFDGNIPASDIKVEGREKVNTKVVGKYLITYTTVDCHGNKGTATRTINIVDTTKPVIKLNGASTITMNAGEEYVELGATATDNYDSSDKLKVQITGEVNTKVAGEYTIYYNVKDSSNNAAEQVERKVIVKDEIISIESNIPTVNCNYGESQIDLTGLQIKVNWKSGTSSNISINENMIVKDYDLTQVGKHTITVQYEGFETSFEINVCKPINAIELIENGRQNITQIEGGYKANSQEDFILGTLRAVQIENVSTLKQEQVQIETYKVIDGTEQETNELTVSVEQDEQGNVLIKGNTPNIGSYKINVYIMYGADERIEKTITLEVVKNNKVNTIELETIKEEEVRLNQSQPVIKELTIKNINNEELEVMNKDLKIENLSEGISITRLNKDKKSIEREDTAIVKYLEIATTLKQQKEVTFTLKSGEVSKEITFKTGDALVLTSIEIGADKLELYTEEPKNSEYTVKREGNDFYTIVPINFYNQKGEKIDVPASSIKQATQGSTIINTALQDENNVVIVAPKASVKYDGESEIDKAIKTVKLYDKNGEPAVAGTYVAKIGIAITSGTGVEVELNTLEGKNIEFRCQKQNKITNLPISVNYREISRLSIDETVSKNIIGETENKEKIVVANKEFILGKMEVGTYEGPLTKEALELSTNGMDEEVKISYELDENNNLVIKGTILEEGYYQITASVKGTSIKAPNIFLKAISIPDIEKIQLEKEDENKNVNLLIGKTIQTGIKAISTQKPSGETIKVADLDIAYDVNSIDVKYLNSGRKLVKKDQPDAEVAYLEISNLTGAEEGIQDLTITLYKGKENEYTETKKVKLYEGVPRSIDIAQTVQIFEEENENTTTVGGKIYTLVPVKAYADEQKTQEIDLKQSTFVKIQVSKEQILTSIPRIDIQIKDDTEVEPVTPIDVKYFNNSKSIASTSDDVAFVGFAYNVDEEEYVFDKTELNKYQITFKCTNNSNTSIVNMKYVAPVSNPEQNEQPTQGEDNVQDDTTSETQE